jgi:RNA-directed DNA polymerase
VRPFRKHYRIYRVHQAIAQSLDNINSGYQDIVDIDLKSFFDEVQHYVLLELIYKKVKCQKTLKLLRAFLRAPTLINGKLQKRRKGVPQGSPLSPLLSNIILNELDKELEKRGHRYVRYADDFSIYVRSKKAAKRVGNSIYKFLRDKLHLPINREKSGIRRPTSFKVLGFGFVPTYKKGQKKPERKRKNLIRLGIGQGQAYAWSRTRMGGWRVAQSPILGSTITIQRLKKRGYISFVEYYQKGKFQ